MDFGHTIAAKNIDFNYRSNGRGFCCIARCSHCRVDIPNRQPLAAILLNIEYSLLACMAADAVTSTKIARGNPRERYD
jgi:phosphoheptose isomerase